ncbi:site-specific tyrosine recombinase XerD [soil metagenome]
MTKKHPGTFENRGAYQRLILYCGGVRHTFRLDTFDKKASEKFAREKLRELQKQHDRGRMGAAGVTKFSTLLDAYLRDEMPTLAAGTQRSYRDSFSLIREYFVDELRDPSLDRIGTKEIKGYLAWRRSQRRVGKHQAARVEPLSNRTLQKDRAVLHRLFDYADRLELREGNPVSRVEQPKADARTPVLLSDDQFDALLAQCADHPHLWLYVLTLGETGGRCVSEILHLRFDDVDLAEGFIEIKSGTEHRTKTGKSRFVPMTPQLLTAMKAHFARFRFASYNGAPSPWLFHHTISRRWHVAGERVKSFRNSFDRAAKDAGIPDAFHRHDLRHRRVTTWLAAGKDVVHVKEALGHSDLRTTMGYTHLSREHLRSLVSVPSTLPEAIDKQA